MVCKGRRPPSDGHAGLTDIAEFHIWKAHPDYSIPAGLTAVYGDLLSDVAPGEGFVWEVPDQAVGNVGQRTFRARFTPADAQNYLIVQDVEIPVCITPKPTSLLWVSEVSNAQEADHLTVLDGTKQLYQGVDYLLTSQQSGGRVILTLTFQGNYTGVVTRSYPVSGSGGSPAPVPVPSVPVIRPPASTPKPSPSASSSQEISESSPDAKPHPPRFPAAVPARLPVPPQRFPVTRSDPRRTGGSGGCCSSLSSRCPASIW